MYVCNHENNVPSRLSPHIYITSVKTKKNKKVEKISTKRDGGSTTKINNRLSKGSSVTKKVAEGKSSKRNNCAGDKESLV